MPNWCSNVLTIRTKKEIIEELRKEFKDASMFKDENGLHSKGLLTVIAPIPEYVPEEWYKMHVDYWGTKWDVPFYEVYFNNDDEDEISAAFETAWGPPIGACKALLAKLIERDPDAEVSCRYEEGGCNFIGIWTNEVNEDWYITDLYASLIEKDDKAIEFASKANTDLDHLAESYFCIEMDHCRCYICDPDNPIKTYQSFDPPETDKDEE